MRIASFPVPHEWNVEPTPEHVTAARHLIVDIATEWRLPLSADAMRDLELCACEIIANSVQHTKTRCRVTMHWTGERLRLEVRDSSLRPPEVGKPDTGEIRGRGLALVQALAQAWGWQPSGNGKTVWIEIGRDRISRTDEQLSVLLRTAHQRIRTAPAAE